MAPKIFVLIIILIAFVGLTLIILSIVKYKKWSSNTKFALTVFGIIIIFYAFISGKHLIHYNQVKQADKFWLKYMFAEYVKKFNEFPKEYSDLRKSTNNAHKLFENAFPFINPNIKFKIINESGIIKVTFYETGYDKIDERLSKQIKSPLTIFGINIRGDFLIVSHEFKISDLFLDPQNVENSIQEAVFRHQFEHNVSGQQQTAEVYFLSVKIQDDSTGYWNNIDPRDELLSKFADNEPPVRPFSKCITSVRGVFDKDTGERGLLFQVDEIRWITLYKVEVDGGYYEAGLSSSVNIYYLEYIEGQWIVTRDVMKYIS